MSGPEKHGAAAPAKDPYIDLAERIYIGLSSRVYSVGGEQKKPDPKALAAFSFRLADAFEDAFRETPREKARIEALNKASVKIDQVDISAMFGATTPPQK
jgi:hypothetical protein